MKKEFLHFKYKGKKYAFAGKNIVYLGIAGRITVVTDNSLILEMSEYFINKSKMETKSEKPKVDVAAIVAKARAKTAEVKDSTKKVQEKNDSYRVVPGFKKYEFNGNILRNTETKIVIKFKTGRTKYQLKDDGGKSHNLSNDDIRKMMPSSKPEKEVKQPKGPKEPKVKKENNKVEGEKKEFKYHHVPKPIPIDDLDSVSRKIMKQDITSYQQIIQLHEAGFDKARIIEITGRRNDVVSKYLRPLLKAKK